MPDVIASISAAIALSRQLVDLNAKVKNAEFQSILSDLQLQLAEVKIRLADVLQERDDLKRKLQAKDELPEVRVVGDVYYTTEHEGPYCTSCYDANERLIRVTPMGGPFQLHAKYRCNMCKGHFQGEDTPESN